VEYARFADDLVILVNHHPQQDWLFKAVEKRLREELAKLDVVATEKTNFDLNRRASSRPYAG
jgi:RNA-directed DNA polymerase